MPLFGAAKPKVDMNQFLRDVTKWGLSLGIGSAAAGGIAAGASKGIEKVEDVLTSKKKKEAIIKIKPELAKLPKEHFNSMFNTVQSLGFAADPLFAAETMKRLHEMPESVVGLVPELMKARSEFLRSGGSPSRLSSAISSAAKKPMIGDLEGINFP